MRGYLRRPKGATARTQFDEFLARTTGATAAIDTPAA